MTNCIFLHTINRIGGIETFLYEMAKIYQNYDVTIYYVNGDPEQIKRLKNYVRVKKYNNEKIKCKRAIFNYLLFGLENIEADEIIQVIHADYKAINLKPNIDKRVNRYLAVSKQVAKSFEELSGIKCEVCYNPIQLEKPKKVLNLISATRLTAEKGKDRMIKFAKALDEAGIPYIWTIFTDDTKAINNPNIIYMQPRLDIRNHIANADYTIQLSDTEGYCYTVLESLCLGTPVIITKIPSLIEMGANKENSFILDFDMKDIPIKDIYEKKLEFTYTPKNNTWDKYLVKSKSSYKEDMKRIVKVKCIVDFYDDMQLQKRIYKKDDPFEVNKLRAEELAAAGVCEEVE